MPNIEESMRPYQKQVLDFAMTRPRCGLFLSMGLGKTMIVLSKIYKSRPNAHVLVIAPKNIARSTWIQEIQKWQLPLRYKSLLVSEKDVKLTPEKRHALYQEAVTAPPTMYFINRELLSDLYKNLPVIDGKRRWYYPHIILDESQGFKNPKSQRFKLMKQILPCTETFIELTGTPAPKDLMDLWSQVYMLDGGQRLGRTISQYRREFFRETLYVNGYPVRWEPLPGAEDEIYRRISDIVISVKNLATPPVIYNDVPVYLDQKDMVKYREFMKTQVLSLPGIDDIEAINRAVLHGKLSQMASGTIYTDSQKNYEVIHSKKLDMCESVINASDGNILIAYKYQSDMKELAGRFPDAEIFDGSNAMMNRWNQREIKIMLIHPASCGFGLNLQFGGHTLIWYTIPDNLEHYLQTNARLPRTGQTDTVIIHHLIAVGTVDEGTMLSLYKKEQRENALLDAVQMAIQNVTEE